MGVTDSEDEAETGEDLERIEAAAAAINQRLPQSPVAQLQDEIQVRLSACHMMCPVSAWLYRPDFAVTTAQTQPAAWLVETWKELLCGQGVHKHDLCRTHASHAVIPVFVCCMSSTRIRCVQS